MTHTGSNEIQAINRAFSIIETLSELGGAGVSELSRAVDLPKSTVHNHLNTLVAAEYVVKDGSEYRAGLKFLQIGEQVRNQHALYQIARPQVHKTVKKTGEITGVMTEEHGRGVFIYRERGTEAARIDTRIGDRVPLHSTALGKVILAFLPEDRRNEIIDHHGLKAVTENTITDRDTLLDELEEARQKQVAFDDEERLNGLRSVAAPILTANGEIIGSISIAGPTHRMQGKRFFEEFPETILGVANVIELNIQHA